MIEKDDVDAFAFFPLHLPLDCSFRASCASTTSPFFPVLRFHKAKILFFIKKYRSAVLLVHFSADKFMKPPSCLAPAPVTPSLIASISVLARSPIVISRRAAFPPLLFFATYLPALQTPPPIIPPPATCAAAAIRQFEKQSNKGAIPTLPG